MDDNTDTGMKTDIYDRIEKTVDIYVTAEAVRDNKHKKEMEDSNTVGIQSPEHTGSECLRSRSSRAATVCLGLLCVLLLAAVIVLCVQIITERDQFHIKSKNLTEEREQLLTNNTNLTEEREQLLTNNTKLTEERDQLLTNNTNLTEERNQLRIQNLNLTKEKNILLCEKDGGIYYQFSCYISPENQWKSWSGSKSECEQRGADLMIINNREEHDYIRNIFNDNSWIGLSDSAVEGTWKWVDGSTLTSGFWKSGEPNANNTIDEDCVASGSAGWYDWKCQELYRWICEKSILK